MTVADLVKPRKAEKSRTAFQFKVSSGRLARIFQKIPIGIANTANETKFPSVQVAHISMLEPSNVANELPKLESAAIIRDFGSRNVEPPIACQLVFGNSAGLT